MSTSGGLNCKKHSSYHVKCKDCIIEELQAKLNRQASSHGLHITQTLEPKIYELETEISRLTKMVIEYRIVYEDNCHTNGTIMFENEKLREALNAVKIDAIKCEQSENPTQYCITQWAMNKVELALE